VPALRDRREDRGNQQPVARDGAPVRIPKASPPERFREERFVTPPTFPRPPRIHKGCGGVYVGTLGLRVSGGRQSCKYPCISPAQDWSSRPLSFVSTNSRGISGRGSFCKAVSRNRDYFGGNCWGNVCSFPFNIVEKRLCGTGGRTRTGTGFTPSDFESDVSTNFTTPAGRARPRARAAEYSSAVSASSRYRLPIGVDPGTLRAPARRLSPCGSEYPALRRCGMARPAMKWHEIAEKGEAHGDETGQENR
jgi:hypothetical protein